MDEVEHRRRRTRSGRSTDSPHDSKTVADDPSARTVGVTPADIAERAAAGSAGSPETGTPTAPPALAGAAEAAGATEAAGSTAAGSGAAGSGAAGSGAAGSVAAHESTPTSALESATVELPAVRSGGDPVPRHTRTRPDGGPSPRGGEDRHLSFDAHSAHPINEERDGERGLRGLIGSGATQVSVGAAMRARDAARPTEAELAEAEATLTIVHRGWVPRGE